MVYCAMTMQGDVIQKKIHDVKKVKPSPRNMMNMRNDPSSKPVFFSGMSKKGVPNQVNNSSQYSNRVTFHSMLLSLERVEKLILDMISRVDWNECMTSVGIVP
jgi:hypothetical protein